MRAYIASLMEPEQKPHFKRPQHLIGLFHDTYYLGNALGK